ncbi:RNaseH domain-containing protein [Streptomyces sp. NRRL S-340]|uniref:RNaseH domain-containing protein n=1 Tax=Streptomyces sp. NRRL S-340 TaxID=1463901 RepID=UPI00056532FE|nr:RNaseH domain-containing protein [Streptomyces sp. NRRL S-340]
MAAAPTRLYTADFPLNPDLMGQVWLYPLTPEFEDLWEICERQWDPEEGFRTPHGALRVALGTVTGRMIVFTVARRRDVRSGEERSLIVADGPLDPRLTTRCFDVWQKLHFRGVRDGQFLSHHIDFERAVCRPLSDVLKRDEAGYITGPWWWKDAAGWAVIQRLAAHPMVDKAHPAQRATTFRVGLAHDAKRLVAWDYPYYRTIYQGRSNERTGWAMAYVSVTGETQRGLPDPVLRFDCHVTRVADHWSNVKTVTLNHPQFDTLLRVPVRHVPQRGPDGEKLRDNNGRLIWKTEFRGHTAAIVQACGLTPVTLPDKADGDLERVRAVFRNKGSHLVGKGVGAYFTLRMTTHIADVLGVQPITYDKSRYTIPGATITRGPIPAKKLPPALEAAGWKSMRLVVVHAADTTPRRVMRQLRQDYGVPIPEALVGSDARFDAKIVDIAPAITVEFRKIPELTMHGSHDRTSIVRSSGFFHSDDPDRLVATICETTWDGKPIPNDGKPPTRKALAAAGVVSQFLTAADVPTKDEETDFRASAALRHIFQNAGIIDDRLARATCAAPDVRMEAPLTEPVTVVGIHLRRHNYRRVRGQAPRRPKLVACLVAMHFTPDAETPPYTEMYHNGQWLRFAEGRAAYHASEIGNENWGRNGNGARAVRDHIETALDSLILPEGHNRVVLVLDKEGSRSIYPGMGDNPFAGGLLPGRGLAQDGVDVAVVRIAFGHHAARPATVYRDGSDDLATMSPSYRRTLIFEKRHPHETVWMLTQQSRQQAGNSPMLREGNRRTREDFHTLPFNPMNKDLHATSRIEIAIPSPGGWESGDLVAFIARQCDQAVAWDHRTLRSAPLHLAHHSDRDHPDFGSHDPGDGDAGDGELEEELL